MRNRLLLFLIIILVSMAGCRGKKQNRNRQVIVFHAGSLSVPFRQLSDEYEKRNPGAEILLEPAGSLVCARKVTELKKPCDILASADYFVINELLFPDYASWAVRFSTNEMVVAFTEKSKYADMINQSNWLDILKRVDVIYARSDPDSDPCGYRSVISLKLATGYYNRHGVADSLLEKNKEYIRPKEVDLIGLIQSNAIDYIFIYRSVAIQHKLRFVDLPVEINLSDPDLNDLYSSAEFLVSGSKPSETITVRGEYINYSLTLINSAPNRDEALKFIRFILGPEGKSIMEVNGQKPLKPYVVENKENIPEELSDVIN